MEGTNTLKTPKPLTPKGRRSSPRNRRVKSPTKKNIVDLKNNEYSSNSESDSMDEINFADYDQLTKRVGKSLYFASKMPSSSRPSLPLTMLAVNAFSNCAVKQDTLQFLDVELASEIERNACVSSTTLIMALIYLERLSKDNPNALENMKPSELFVISLMVANKLIQEDGEDFGVFNDEWATSANTDLQTINTLELDFLSAMNWNVNVSHWDFEKALQKTEGILALQQGTYRGWFTYTEIQAIYNAYWSWQLLLPVFHFSFIKALTAKCIQYTTLMATLYTTSLLAAPQLYTLTKGISLLLNSELTTQSNLISMIEFPPHGPVQNFSYASSNDIKNTLHEFDNVEDLHLTSESFLELHSNNDAKIHCFVNPRSQDVCFSGKKFVHVPYTYELRKNNKNFSISVVG